MKIPHLVALLLAVSPGPAIAQIGAPPAPIPSPPALDNPVDGYDLRTAYQLWWFWIEGQKGAVIDGLLAEPEAIAGERPIGPPFLRVALSHDFGHYLSIEIRTYCKTEGRFDYARGTCHYVLRRASVPGAVAGYGADPRLSAWMDQTFDAPALAKHLRASGLPPQTHWWSADRATIFSAMPSAAPVLKERAEVVRLDSRDCPAMAKAVVALDKTRLDVPLDLLAVGTDHKPTAPPPHAVTAIYTLKPLVDGGYLTLEGNGRALEKIALPVLRAAETCELERKRKP
jgi:hypothetical protein